MNRRAFITLLGGAGAAWPLAARPQSGKRDTKNEAPRVHHTYRRRSGRTAYGDQPGVVAVWRRAQFAIDRLPS
jgi:hypothetical protein